MNSGTHITVRTALSFGLGWLFFFFGVMASGPHQLMAQESAVSPQLQWWKNHEQARLTDSRLPRCFTRYTSAHVRGDEFRDETFEALFMVMPTDQPDNSYQSPGGHFLIWYDLEGDDAVPPEDQNGTGIPDWVEMVALAADSSRAFYTDSLGLADPVQNASPYNIFIRNLGFYGFTGIQEGQLFSVIDSGFDWVPGNDAEDDAEGAARATVAHEIYHAVQHAYNQWQGPTGITAWLEMDAVTAENQVFPDVKEYLNFLGEQSIFRLPGQGTPYPYDHATWLMFFTEYIGPDFMRHIWERVQAQPDISMEQAIAEELALHGKDYDETIVKLHLWHLASGNWSREGFGFKDAHRYPTSFKRAQRNTLPTQPFTLATLQKNAAGYYAIVPQQDSGVSGAVLGAFFGEKPETGWGLVAYYHDGTAEALIPGAASGHTPKLATADFSWDEIEKLGIAVTNSNPEQSAIHQLLVGNEETIEQIRYGDVTGNAQIREADAQRVLDEVSGKAEVRLGFARAYAGDVSGKGSLTAWDAGLIFRASSGFSTVFPADINESGFGPDLPRFGLEPGDPVPDSIPEISLTFNAEPLYNGEEATIDLLVSGLPANALSVELTVFYDPTLISFREIDSSQSGFGEIIQSTAGRDAVSRRIVWASNQAVGDGVIGRLVFDILEEGTAEVIVTEARINEIEANYILPEVSFEIDPNDPVSAPPGEDDLHTERPHKTGLMAAYPNPFNPATRIPFELHETSEVDLNIYDITGRRTATIAAGRTFAPGTHALTWNADGFATGIYIIEFRAKNTRETVRETMRISLVR